MDNQILEFYVFGLSDKSTTEIETKVSTQSSTPMIYKFKVNKQGHFQYMLNQNEAFEKKLRDIGKFASDYSPQERGIALKDLENNIKT